MEDLIFRIEHISSLADEISSQADDLADKLRLPEGREREIELAAQLGRLAKEMAASESGYKRDMLVALSSAALAESNAARRNPINADEISEAYRVENRAWDDVRRML